MYIISRNIIRFLVVVVFQVLVMDNVMINGYMVPYIYLLFILLLPFETPRWIQLFSGFCVRYCAKYVILARFWPKISDPPRMFVRNL